jgi:N-dimethylarginine dimethylaminohydrolase
MLSKNEWDPLQAVIVGIADDAKIPQPDISLRLVNYADKDQTFIIPQGTYPRQIIEEANEDLQKLCDFFSSENILVHRPDKSIVPEYYNFCPRDTVIVHDNTIIATPVPLRARKDEFLSMSKTLEIYGKVIHVDASRSDNLYNTTCVGNANVLALNETEPIFDAANVLRCNDDLFYLVSNSGNKAGAELLQKIFPDKHIHIIENVYSYMHLDSTIAFLREGLMLLNPARIKSIDQLPKILHGWDVIWAPEPVDIGHYPGYCNASQWINVNLLSINPNLVVIEEHQHNLRKLLEINGIECVMLPMRHARTLGGCFHCVTLDLLRHAR